MKSYKVRHWHCCWCPNYTKRTSIRRIMSVLLPFKTCKFCVIHHLCNPWEWHSDHNPGRYSSSICSISCTLCDWVRGKVMLLGLNCSRQETSLDSRHQKVESLWSLTHLWLCITAPFLNDSLLLERSSWRTSPINLSSSCKSVLAALFLQD